MHTSFIAKVISYDETKHRADIQPLMTVGGKKYPMIQNVPVLRHRIKIKPDEANPAAANALNIHAKVTAIPQSKGYVQETATMTLSDFQGSGTGTGIALNSMSGNVSVQDTYTGGGSGQASGNWSSSGGAFSYTGVNNIGDYTRNTRADAGKDSEILMRADLIVDDTASGSTPSGYGFNGQSEAIIHSWEHLYAGDLVFCSVIEYNIGTMTQESQDTEYDDYELSNAVVIGIIGGGQSKI